jgi:2-aminoadipate transaminase
MRLNFSGSDEAEIREGIKRIGAVVSEQVELYETLTMPAASSASRRGAAGSPEGPAPDGPGDVVPIRPPHDR